METTDLAILMGGNFVSVFLAVWMMRIADRLRKRKLAKLILDEMGERAETDNNFKDIISKNFPSIGEDNE